MNASHPRILQMHNLSFSYPDYPVFSSLSSAIPAGLTLVTGDEGTGKTSLARILAGELKADSGDITFCNAAATVFYIAPRSAQYDQCTVHDFIHEVIPQQFPNTHMAALPTLAEGLSLAPHMDKKLFMLSTGSKRKVWLAAGILSQADLTILDDPFAALDHASIRFATQMLNTTFSGNAGRACMVMAYEPPIGLENVHHIALDKASTCHAG